MPELTFVLCNNKKIVVQSEYGLSILEIAIKNNIEEIKGVCGGSAICGTCHIVIDKNKYVELISSNPINQSEDLILNTLPFRDKYSRLACQIVFTNILNKQEIKIFNG